jgi:hypothetical protein
VQPETIRKDEGQCHCTLVSEVFNSVDRTANWQGENSRLTRGQRFIATSIVSDVVIQAIKAQLDQRGQEFAQIDDAVKAVMRVAADKSINGKLISPNMEKTLLSSTGRSLGVVPRNIRKEGFIDLEQDDRVEGTVLYELEASSQSVTHRTLPQKQQ